MEMAGIPAYYIEKLFADNTTILGKVSEPFLALTPYKWNLISDMFNAGSSFPIPC